MKKLYAAAALLAVIIAVGFAEHKAANDAAESVLTAADRASEAAYSESGELEELCKNARDEWNRRKPVLELFLPHQALDETDITAEKLVIYADLGDRSSTLITLSELKNRMIALRESEEVDIYNLL